MFAIILDGEVVGIIRGAQARKSKVEKFVHIGDEDVRIGAKWEEGAGFFDVPPARTPEAVLVASPDLDLADLPPEADWIVIKAILGVINANKSTLDIPPASLAVFKKIKQAL